MSPEVAEDAGGSCGVALTLVLSVAESSLPLHFSQLG